MKKLYILLLIAFVFTGKIVLGQGANVINITVNIVPPYSPYYSDYSGSNASKVLLTVQNMTNTPQRIKLAGQLQGDNGVKITTKSNYVPLQPIILNPNEVKQLNGLVLKDIFDLNTLNVYGVDKAKIIQTSRIPEGNYSFCIQALDYATAQLLSSNAPLGCTSMSITYPDAPVLVSPANAANVEVINPQYLNFNWMSTVSGNIQYNIQMALLPDRVFKDPNQVLDESSFPLLSQTVNGFSYPYSISNLALTPGSKYAWRVRAIDPTGKIVFKNNGYSAASVFTYAAPVVPLVSNLQEIKILLPSPDNANKTIEVNNKYALYLRWKLLNTDEDVSAVNTGIAIAKASIFSNPLVKKEHVPYKYVIEVKDKLTKNIVDTREALDGFYYSEKAGKPSLFVSGRAYDFTVRAYAVKILSGLKTMKSEKTGAELPAARPSLTDYNVLVGESRTGMFIYKKIGDTLAGQKYITLAGTVKYKFEKYPQLYPLSGPFQLTKYFRQLDKAGKVIKDNINPSAIYPTERYRWAVWPEKDGRFEIKVPVLVMPENTVAYYKIEHTGNKYYNSPEKVIEIDSTNNAWNVGEFVSTVYSYKLNLHITKGYQPYFPTDKPGVSEAPKGLNVVIYRVQKGLNIPRYEGQDTSLTISLSKDNMLKMNEVLVARGKGKVVNVPNKPYESIISFDRLLCAIDANDLYKIRVYDSLSKIVMDEPFNFQPESVAPNKHFDSFKSAGKQTYEVEKKLNWNVVEAPAATVKGRLLYKYNDGVGGAKPLAGKKVKLQAFIVLQETSSNKTYALPVSKMNSLTQVDKNNEYRMSDQKDKKLEGYLNGADDKAIDVTTTQADGSFVFPKVAVWDSVFVSDNYYNFVLPYPVIEVPNTNNDKETVRDLYMASLLGDKDAADKARAELIKRLLEDATNPVVNPVEKFGVAETIDVTQGITGSNQSNGYGGYDVRDVKVTNVATQVQQGIKKNVKTNTGGPNLLAEQEVALADPKVITSPSPCTAKVVYRLVVEDSDLFCSPDDNIEINPLQTLDVGMLYSTVRTMRVKSKVYKGDEYKKNDNDPTVDNIPVQVYREAETYGIVGEGEPVLYPQKNDVKLLDQRVTNPEGVIFTHLLRNKPYTLKAVIGKEANNSSSYIADQTAINFQFKDNEVDKIKALYKDFLFNSDFQEEEFPVNLILAPDEPVIAGRILNSVGTKGIQAAFVRIETATSSFTANVSPDGYFYYKSGLLSNGATVTISVDGYTPTNTSDNTENNEYRFPVGIMKKGQKFFANYYFTPAASLKGYVVNAKNEHIPSLYKIQALDFIQETTGDCSLDYAEPSKGGGTKMGKTGIGVTPIGGNIKSFNLSNVSHTAFTNYLTSTCKQSFVAYTPMNTGARLIIIPNDLKYFNDTLAINYMTEAENAKIYERRLITREHRIRFIVRGNKNGVMVALPQTKIEILDTTLVTDASGVVQYSFMNISEENFTVRVKPKNEDFIAREFTFTNKETKKFVNQFLDMDMGVMVQGQVLLNGEPLPRAVVYVDDNRFALPVTQIADGNGRYMLTGIKPTRVGQQTYQVTITASAPEGRAATERGTILAQKQSINPEQTVTANFDLQQVDGVNLTTLLGYNVILEAAIETNRGFVITGEIDLANAKGDFQLPNPEMRLGFVNLPVVSAGRDNNGLHYVVPENKLVPLDGVQFKARFKESYNALIMGVDGSPIALQNVDGRNGALQISAKIVDNSFDFPSTYLSFSGTEFYFAPKTKSTSPDGTVNEIDTYSNTFSGFGTKKQTEPLSYHFTNQYKQGINFGLLNFPATSSPADTYFANGKIRLLPVIKPSGINTLNSQPLSISLPEVLIDKSSVSKINGTTPLEFKLGDKWTIYVPKWEFSTEEGGIVALKGSNNQIRTGALDIPFDKFRLRNDILLIDSARLNSIKLGNIVNLNVVPGTQSTFGIDSKIGVISGQHYILRMLGQGNKPAGTLNNLQGFKEDLEISAVTLVSNGEQYVDFAPNSKTINAFGFVKFQPLMLESTNTSFAVLGNVDLGIPRLQTFYGGFRYTGPNTVTPDFKGVKFDIGKGYVVFESPVNKSNKFDNLKTITDNELKMYGKVYEPNNQLDSIGVLLTHTPTSTTIGQNGPASFSYPGKTPAETVNMDVTNTTTKVDGGDWDYLTFTGKMRTSGKPMAGFDGENPMPFKVYGEVSCDDGELKVSGMSTPFGSMRLVFNWAKKELIGNLQMENMNLGGVSMTGEAEIAMGGNGFYLMAAGDVDFGIPPFSPVRAGVLLGKYNDISMDVLKRTMQFNRNKELPICAAANQPYNLIGLLVSGRKDLFKPLNEQIDLPPLLPLLSVSLAAEVGVDASIFVNFDAAPAITLAVGAFGEVSVAASSITGTSASGRVSVDVKSRFAYVYGKAFTASLMAGLNLSYTVVQKIPLMDDIRKSGEFNLSAEARFTTSPANVSFDLSTNKAAVNNCAEVKQ
ncbi:carboxypeptidase-like regulatory domain-containing protein [Pedobacter psychroterrae]|uniref:Carboxypeptidase regulatory-like domain-containing protein n=1 Tax=Pedobacter psychroterrae TaxID=2530453 RepID=A0A4R0N8R8_9SPHI|nr:carboxypeptidase-like regulatory domain-containing protein [Pedobacter psychroterrae]TCC96415.1 carboxypeptidase regulatory-like domain-containing protein [Pedobacter psychroterrae]